MSLCLALLASGASADPIVTETFVNAPAATVWSLFTTAEGRRHTGAAHAEVDLRIGGQIRTHRDADGKLGDAGTLVEEVLAYDPGRMLATRATQAPADSPHSGLAATAWRILYVTSSGEDMTHVRIVALGYGESTDHQALRRDVADGQRQELDGIAKQFWPLCARCAAQTEAASP